MRVITSQFIFSKIISVPVVFHPPVEGLAFASRKALAEHCFAVISAGVQAQNRGRPSPASAAPPPGAGTMPSGNAEPDPAAAGAQS